MPIVKQCHLLADHFWYDKCRLNRGFWVLCWIFSCFVFLSCVFFFSLNSPVGCQSCKWLSIQTPASEMTQTVSCWAYKLYSPTQLRRRWLIFLMLVVADLQRREARSERFFCRRVVRRRAVLGGWFRRSRSQIHARKGHPTGQWWFSTSRQGRKVKQDVDSDLGRRNYVRQYHQCTCHSWSR